MKKILVPIDFSEHSEYALETAAILARKCNAKILALQMLELPNAILTSFGDSQQIETNFSIKLAEKKFEEFLNKDYLKNVVIIPVIKYFKLFSEVNEVAKEQNADFIVMGSHGASGVKEFFIGSNTEKVVRHSDIPVLVIKHNPILMDFENVVFACDFSQEAIKPYIYANNIFKELNIKMHLLYLNLPNESFRSSTEMEKIVANFFKTAEDNYNKMGDVTYINDYTIEQGILNFSNVIGADLVAIATHGRTGLAHLFGGSISEDIVNHSTLPVMTFKI